MPPSISVAAFVFGIVLLLAAIVGKELKIAAIELPALTRGTRLLAGITGVALLYIGLFDPIKPATSSPAPTVPAPTVVPTIPVPPSATAEPPTPTAVLPTPTAMPTAIPDSRISAAFVAFSNLRVVYDVNDPGTNQYGMETFAAFTITGYQSKLCRAVAYFFDANMKPLADANGQYNTTTSEVATSVDFTPGFDPATYSGPNELRLFIPYDELHLVKGTHNLLAAVWIYELPSLRLIGRSGTVPFRVTQN